MPSDVIHGTCIIFRDDMNRRGFCRLYLQVEEMMQSKGGVNNSLLELAVSSGDESFFRAVLGRLEDLLGKKKVRYHRSLLTLCHNR